MQFIPCQVPVELYQWPRFQKEVIMGEVTTFVCNKKGQVAIRVGDLIFEAKNVFRDYFASYSKPGEFFAQLRLEDIVFFENHKICRLSDFLRRNQKVKP